MKRETLLRQLPIALVVVTAGIGIAQSATTGRVFPYVGYLEENGFPVDGERDLRINLYASAGAGTACETQYFDAVTVANGRFKVDVEDVPDACLVGGELYAGVSVGPVGGTLTDLSTGEGTGRVMIGAVPFAAASPKAATLLVEQDADIGGNLAVAGDAAIDGHTQTGSLTVAGNATAASTFVGDVGHGAEWAGVSHSSQANVNNYALLQHNTGANTLLNTAAGGAIRFRSSNVDRMVMDASGNLTVNGTVDAYRLLPDYETGWINVSAGDERTFAHNLGQNPTRYTVFVATGGGGTGDVSIGGGMWNYGTEPESRGVMITGITPSQFTVKVGRDYLVDSWGMGDANNRVLSSSGSYYIMVWR